ncbi:MAG: 1-acyl-sn-glycerol-3-phosphate acyltransferase [Blastocatellia bacterium]|nr:1-acyl-sn-glycerol-3-phosphate acyltransferase [Blastocatellia bacterium]
MKQLRVILKVIALCSLTAFLYALWISVNAFVFASEKTSRGWRSFIFRKWAGAAAAITGMRTTVYGTPPRPPFFLVSNHLSYMDIIALAAHLDCVFIAKSDVARWPVIGRLCRSAKTIFIDRKNRKDITRVIRLIERSMSAEQGVVLFAEGTSTEGARVLPFNSSLLEPAARAGYRVSYASISYSAPAGEVPAHMSVCWWGDMTFTKHLLELFRLPEFHATLVFGEETFQEADRKVLADKLWRAVQSQFIPVVKKEEEEWSASIR